MILDGSRLAEMFKGFAQARKKLEEAQDERAQDYFFKSGCAQEIQFPGFKVTVKIGQNRPDGRPAKNKGKLVLTAGKFGTPTSRFFATATFHRDGTLVVNPEKDFTPMIGELLEALAMDPQGTFALHRPETANCCFCGRELTDPPSVWAGYGPTCAAYRGLPHGEIGPNRRDFIGLKETQEALCARASSQEAPARATEAPRSPSEPQEAQEPTKATEAPQKATQAPQGLMDLVDELFYSPPPADPAEAQALAMRAFDHPEEYRPRKAPALLTPAQRAAVLRQQEDRVAASGYGRALAPMVAVMAEQNRMEH